MVPFTSSSIPDNPTLRSHALNTVIVVPLLSAQSERSSNAGKTYSDESFETLFKSLSDINLERELPLKKKKVNDKEVTLIIPNANLTPPGDWRYDDTPLKSHDWSLGCQRLLFADGKRSIQSLDRLKSFAYNDQETRSSQYGEFIDLYPSRGTSAVIGVLNVKDCNSLADLRKAEDELDAWLQKYTPLLYAQKYWEEAFDSPMAPKHFIDKRMFVFDSFEEGNNIDLSLTRLKPGELIAFPPTDNMDLHLNVVINDLAVSTFVNLERRIKVLDKLGFEYVEPAKGKNEKKSSSTSRIGDIADIVGPNSNLNDLSLDEDDIELIAGTGTRTAETTSETSGRSNKTPGKIALPGLRGFAANAVKALNKGGNDLVQDIYASLPPIEHELQTPIDMSFDEAVLTSKDIETIFRRNAARREKHAADFALQAGSVMDAYDRYTKAAEASKLANDPLWYAAALEGLATCFVAMADTGGHGADIYLENNFQYPDDVMMAALTYLANSEDGKEMTKLDKSKTAMPRAILALLEEAAGIYSRNIKLASIYSELLLKMAWYSAELESLHNLCRWGDGFSGLEDTDGYTMIASVNGTQKRWELTSVHKIDLETLRKRGKVDATLSLNSSLQCQRFVAYLHQACANGGLDTYTRAFVAIRCAKLCLKGVRLPHWGNSNKVGPMREILPRKAAYFSVVAAESMSQCITIKSATTAEAFWVAAAHLYAKNSNRSDGSNLYAWACLRATILHALSVYGGAESSEKALESLLLLLGYCTPTSVKRSSSNRRILTGDNTEQSQVDDEFMSRKNLVTPAKPNNHSRGKSGSFPAQSAFFSPTPSQAMTEQSKWVDDEQVPMILLPLVEPSSKVAVLKGERGEIKFLKKTVKAYQVLAPLISLHCVIPEMEFNQCIRAQDLCISRLFNLRRKIATTSPDYVFNRRFTNSVFDNSQVEKTPRENEMPLLINSVTILKSEPHLLLNKVTVAGCKDKASGSLATFFNPYASKNNDSTQSNKITLIAQGEERIVVVEFRNHLAVPLEIPNCELVFDKPRTIIDVEASTLSFILPPRVEKYRVYFPFTVASISSKLDDKVQRPIDGDTSKESPCSTFEVIGVKVSIFGRSFFIPFESISGKGGKIKWKSEIHQVPTAISNYTSSTNKVVPCDSKLRIALEVVPPQPNILFFFSNSQTRFDDSVVLPVQISDGEVVKIPSLRIVNDAGSSCRGVVERLQILCIGLPASPEKILFDTDNYATNSIEDKRSENDGHLPLKITILPGTLSLSTLNGNSPSVGDGIDVSFELAAAHDMGERIKNGGIVKIRFRYRGSSPTPSTEVWRKREISLKIMKVQGPRISYLAFRPDLSWGSPYSDLCHALAYQSDVKPNHCETGVHVKEGNSRPDSEVSIPEQKIMLSRNVFHISTEDVVILMTVVNDTNSTIILSHHSGVIGGFQQEEIPTMEVSSGVSVKIPITIPRIKCFDDSGNATDISDELSSLMALKWESVPLKSNHNNENALFPQGKRQGSIQIPSRCLKKMVDVHESFSAHVCTPPLSTVFLVNGKAPEVSHQSVQVGISSDLSMIVNRPACTSFKALKDCTITLEFCCARKSSGLNPETCIERNHDAFIWCGQSKKSFQSCDLKDMTHRSRLCFTTPGEFIVSGCVRIKNGHNQEIWWAPRYQSIHVYKVP